MTINERQNRDLSLKQLAAQRYLYSRAKTVRYTAMFIVVIVATLGLVASVVNHTQFTQFLPAIVLLSWLLDQWLLAPWERTLRTEAATIQEAFDCFVLAIPWPSWMAVEPTEDRIKQLTIAARGKKDLGPLSNWYPPNAIPDDPILAKLHCQKTNSWWDFNLREKWICFVQGIFWGLIILLILLSILTGLTVEKFLAILATSIRAMAWALNERANQNSAVERVRRIHSFVSGFRPESSPTDVDIRGVQDAIFHHRRSTLALPDWLYRLYRQRQESEAGG